MLKPNEIKSIIILKRLTHKQIANEIGIKTPQLSNIINLAYRVIYEMCEIIGENPFEIKPDEIKLKMISQNINQKQIADKIGITQSQISNIITYGNLVRIKLSEIIGENPFEIEEIKNNEHGKNHRRKRNKKRIKE